MLWNLGASWTLGLATLATITSSTAEFYQYSAEVRWAQDFALLNREAMIGRTLTLVPAFMSTKAVQHPEVDCLHNFKQNESHSGKNLWVSRKGEISAREDERGLILGSMGATSYAMPGLGNQMSFCSAPHGAGRNFPRSTARKAFTPGQLREAMKGIDPPRDTAQFIDEAPKPP